MPDLWAGLFAGFSSIAASGMHLFFIWLHLFAGKAFGGTVGIRRCLVDVIGVIVEGWLWKRGWLS